MQEVETEVEVMENAFNRVCDDLMNELDGDESLSISMKGERSRFIRLNAARIRQDGVVREGRCTLEFIRDGRRAKGTLDFTGIAGADSSAARAVLHRLRKNIGELPEDPRLVPPAAGENSREIHHGRLPESNRAAEEILGPLHGEFARDGLAPDLTGIYAAGLICSGAANSAGRRHWFAAENFSLDYSLSTPRERMVKGVFAGREWDGDEYRAGLAADLDRLAVLERDARRVSPGRYRVYLAPAAAADIIGMFGWGALSEGALRRGSGALIKMREGAKKFSPLFSLSEDFRGGGVPRFNSLGEIAPEYLPLIQKGELVNTLISSRSAKEYDIASNQANTGESLRAPAMSPGQMAPEDAAARLSDGLYLSNLHYLNWSDRTGARITGMTRYACFVVEKGELTAPMENMRFDDSLYDFLGPALQAVDNRVVWNPDVETYDGRKPGGILAAGMLIDGFELTL